MDYISWLVTEQAGSWLGRAGLLGVWHGTTPELLQLGGAREIMALFPKVTHPLRR